MSDSKKIIFSGIQPTGNLHLGNFLGAIKNFVKLQKDYFSLFCIVDLHALTAFHDPDSILENIREVAAAYLACGINPDKNIIFNQSLVSQHAELAWIFNCVSRLGWLGRMTQFKEKAGKTRENASVGLFVYPNLMAADILLYKATHVPVGDDQKQHLEITRDIAHKFNNDFKVPNFFPLPDPVIEREVARIMSLRDGTKKMGKSDDSDFSRINLVDNADQIAIKIKKAKTDTDLIPGSEKLLQNRPEASNLIGIFASLSDKSKKEILQEFEGKNFSILKKQLIDLLIEKIIPIGKKISDLKKEKGYIDNVLKNGGEKASAIAEKVMGEVYKIIGVRR